MKRPDTAQRPGTARPDRVMPFRRWFLPALMSIATPAFADRLPADGTDAGDDLVVLTWGGAYEASQRAAYIAPFTRATGIEVRTARYDGGIDELRRAREEGAVPWNIVDLEAADARAACREGLLEPFDPAVLVEEDGVPVRDDFDAGSIRDCSVAQLVFSTVIGYDVRVFSGEKPRRVQDFFDLERFPGKRGLRCAPVALLEWALLAYEVPRSQVYDLLSTPRGLDLAFRKLDALRGHIVWWRGGDEPGELLGSGEVVMSSGYNGRFFEAQAAAGAPISLIWDGQLVDHATWAIPRGAKATGRAQAFIAFATRAERMADQAMRISYGPTRDSARRRVGRHVEFGIDMNDHLPTSGERMRRAVVRDSDWYARTETLRQRRFAEWLRAPGVGPCPDARERAR